MVFSPVCGRAAASGKAAPAPPAGVAGTASTGADMNREKDMNPRKGRESEGRRGRNVTGMETNRLFSTARSLHERARLHLNEGEEGQGREGRGEFGRGMGVWEAVSGDRRVTGSW